jgi:WD40 repeat protein
MQNIFSLIATGGAQPGISRFSISNNSLIVDTLLTFPPGQSIYRISLSPSLNRIAAVTKFGDISVFVNDKSMQKERSLLYRTANAPMVYGLTFLTDDILLASGSDYQIRIYDLSRKKDSERIGVLNLTGIAFSLTAINENNFCAIVRENRSDHLFVWDLRTREIVFKGPAFKIASNYFNAAIEIDSVSGIIAHGDRIGMLHLYDTKNNFNYSNLQTNHGNYYGVCFNDGYLFTAGENDRGIINRWNIGQKKIIETYSNLNIPVNSINRLDKDHIIASLNSGQVVLVDHKTIIKEKERKLVQDLRQIISLPSNFVISVSDEEKINYAREQLNKIQTLFDSGQIDQAYKAIIELEANGFEAEALMALAMLENAQGKLLSELESLIRLLNDQPIIDEIIPSIKRLAELLENIHEPELAIYTLQQLNEINGDPAVSQKIEELKPRCIPAFEGVVLLAGFPEKELVKPEIRKAIILNRYFEEAVSFTQEKLTQSLNNVISLDSIVEKLSNKTTNLFSEVLKNKIISKRGQSVSDKFEMIRIIPDKDTLKFVEFWIESRKTFDDTKLVFYQVFYPHAEDKSDKWNDEIMESYNRTINNPLVYEWYGKVENFVRSTIVTSRDEGDEEEDMFSIRRTTS